MCKIGFLLSSFFYEVFIANSSIMHMSCWCETTAASMPMTNLILLCVLTEIRRAMNCISTINRQSNKLRAKNHLIILPFSKSLFKNRVREKWPIFKTSTLFENYSNCLIYFFGIFANFCPIKIDLSSNSVWPYWNYEMRLFLWFSNTVTSTYA